ncbi:MAG: hypothetical protein ABIP53_08800, partial [Candidatus Limnocylindrales bacterium]
AVVEQHLSRIVDMRVAQARLQSDLAGLGRETERVTAERAAAEERLRDAARVASLPAPQPDQSLADELDGVERSLAAAAAAAETSVGGDSVGEALARELAAVRSQHEAQSGRASELETSRAASCAQLDRLTEKLAQAVTERDEAVAALTAATEREQRDQATLDEARATAAGASATLSQTADRAQDSETERASAGASLAAIESALEATTDEGLARAARARGGRLVAEGLEVENRFRTAVAAALDHVASGFVVDDAGPLLATRRRGTIVVRGGTRGRRSQATAIAGPIVAAAQESGGGRLVDAIRRDPNAEVTRLMERVVWVPDLGLALRLAAALQPGWRALTLAGDVVTDEGVIRLGSEEGIIERRAERDALKRRVDELDGQLQTLRADLARVGDASKDATTASRAAQQRIDEARSAVRSAEERERLAERRAEQWLREQAWEQSQVERLTRESTSTAELAARTTADLEALSTRFESQRPRAAASAEEKAAEQARLAELRSRHAQLQARKQAQDERLAAWQEERRRAEISRAIDESRLAELDRTHTNAAARHSALASDASTVAEQLATAQAEHELAASELQAVLAAGADDRARLIEAERQATEARERLRDAEQQTRRSEISQMEARLQLDQIREQLLVELAAIGNDGLIALRKASGQSDEATDDQIGAEAFEPTLEAVVTAWRSAESFATDAPGTSKLASLRRRYHDLGAGNPFAVEEYAELRERLETMEAQRADLEAAIISTRELIANLSAMISEQFRKTFAALEDAFARRFQELFGGGDAQLSLTAPDDLSATGVDIHARPPGKKRQPLSMLSGGERALTAVSLLLAMLEVRPVPFCVLDEVDAALDEANVGRFSKALRGLSEKTQFIVITHNRGTIEGADTLYGVTIGDDAVSRIVSLRLPKIATNGDAPQGLVPDAEVAHA